MAGDFVTVECSDCGNEQTLFGKPATAVNCAVCGTTLAVPTGGKAAIDHEIVDVVSRRSPTPRTSSDDAAEAQ